MTDNKITIIRDGAVFGEYDKFSEAYPYFQAYDEVVFGKGEFICDEAIYTSGSYANYGFGSAAVAPVNFTGQGINTKVIIDCTKYIASKRDNGFITFTSSSPKSIIRNINFVFIMAYKGSENYSHSLFNAQAGGAQFIMQNCVIQVFRGTIGSTTKISALSMGYNNAQTELKNCSLVLPNATVDSYGSGNISITESASTHDIYNLSGTSSVEDAIFDENFRLTNYDNKDYGVYSGEYAWTLDKYFIQNNNKIFTVS